jgi:hypothetical protein
MGSDGIRRGLARSALLVAVFFIGWGKPNIRMGITVTVALGLTVPAACLANLPDGRVYEEVSPANKNGNVVDQGFAGLAAEDGDAVVFAGLGAMGNATSGIFDDFVARRASSGWVTSSAVPPALGSRPPIEQPPKVLVPSRDFSRFVFAADAPYVTAEPLDEASSVNIFLTENPAVEPAWLGRPVSEPPAFQPTPAIGQNSQSFDHLIAGVGPNLDTVYFTYSGTLIPQDAPRTPNIGDGQGRYQTDAWGFYEWKSGVLSEAGVLPDGTLSSFGAVPAAIAGGSNALRIIANPFDQAQTLDNEVSTDGKRAFFVSPDPVASTVTDKAQCEEYGPCTNATPELYVRETAPDGNKRTVLVSRSQIPGHEGEAAPDGPIKVENAPNERFAHSREPAGETYLYASPDGSQAFFASMDQLTSAAPSDGSVKEYDFNVATGSLTYLPSVSGPILVSSSDGSRFVFENTATTPHELDLWQGGAGGGHILSIAQLLETPEYSSPGSEVPDVDVDGGRATADGSVFLFRTNSPLPGGFNNGGGFMQVYRYEVATGKLDCVSCPPVGVTPSGDARVSYNSSLTGPPAEPGSAVADFMGTLETRTLSADGSRVFFDTPDPLVPQDSNGQRDVYEWERGKISLISSGTSSEPSDIVDSSASGDDVFFATSQGLAPGDSDTGYDIYDARVPRPGDIPPPRALPCQGDVCQGPPSVPSLLGPPASAMFSGAGNVVTSEVPLSVKKKPTTKKPTKKKPAKRPKRHRGKPRNRVKKSDVVATRGHSAGQRRGQ